MADAPQPKPFFSQILQRRWARCFMALAEPLSIVGMFVLWLEHSWLHWGDPLIDFPRILYASWRLSVGDQLYVDVVGQYGPLGYLAGAASFRIFGVGLDTLVWMNIVLTAVIIFLLRAIFREVGGRLVGWLVAVIFINLFAFENFYLIVNYNFMAPYAEQAVFGFAGLLLLLWGLLRYTATGRFGWLAPAGFGLAVAYLDKPELLLAAAGSLLVFLLGQTLAQARAASWPQGLRWLGRAAAWLGGGFMVLWLPIFLYFLAQGGWAYALYASNHAIYTVASERVLTNVETSPLMTYFFGFDDPWGNFLDQLNSSAILVVGCGLIVWASRRWVRARTGSFAWAVYLLLAIVPLLAALVMLPDLDFWTDSGEAFAFPVFLATTGCIFWGARAAWQRREGAGQLLRLAVVGTSASLMLVRIILNVRFAHFGFFMTPLSVFFWLQLMVVEAGRPAPGQLRANWLAPAVAAVIALLGTGVLGNFSWSNYDSMTYAVGQGRDQFYAYPPSMHPYGWILNTMLTGAKVAAPDAKLLAVFPGGMAVNYHLRVRSPLPNLEVFPIAITSRASDRALSALQENPPDAVILYARDLSENGAFFFGANKASGHDIILWLQHNYRVAGFAGSSAYSGTHHAVDFLLPDTEPLPPPQKVPVDIQ